MKVISIREPYASLIKKGLKKIETRSWKTNYRGLIYIHVSLAKIEDQNSNLLKLIDTNNLNYGKIICSANLVDCVLMDKKFIENVKKNINEYNSGFYKIGNYAWILKDIKILDNPIKAKGKLGIWNFNM